MSGDDDHLHKYHGHGPLIYDVYQDVNTLPLHPPFDKVEKRRHETMSKLSSKQARHIRQFINVFVGVAIGLCCSLVGYGSDTISEFRQRLIANQLSSMGATLGTSEFAEHAILASGIAVLSYVVCSLAAALIVAAEPRSASSGIPQVIAFLNGVNQKGVLSARVFVAKFFGTMLSFGSGLCLGPEGPMIHMGSMLGLLVVRRVLRPSLKYICGASARKMEEELSRSPLRYDIQAGAMGAGAGVAAAFQAPLAGTMFVVEEASSFFSVKLFFHTFVTCVFAVATSMVVNAALGKPLYTYYDRTTSCFGAAVSPAVILQVSVVAIVCALLAMAFNNLIVWCNTQRALQNCRLQQAGRKWSLRCVRVTEVLIIATLTALLAVWLPASTGCQDASMQHLLQGSGGCVNDAWMYQIMMGTKSERSHRDVSWWDRLRGIDGVAEGPKYFPVGSLLGVKYDPVECPLAIKHNSSCSLSKVILNNATYNIKDFIPEEQKLWQENYYCCGFTNLTSFLATGHMPDIAHPMASLDVSDEAYVQGACPKERTASGVNIRQYSAGSSLWLVKPETVAKTLFTRGSPGLLPMSDLAMYLAGYGTLTALTAGIWVPGGLLVPQLVIGGTAGRLMGEAWVKISKISQDGPGFPWAAEMEPLLKMLKLPFHASELASSASVPDPAIFALAGSAAFLSASGSLALFSVVLLLEITYDWLMLPVIVLAVLVARTVTTLFGSHGLYHRLIDVASLPYLHEHEHWRSSRFNAKDILNEDLRHAQATANVSGEQMPITIEDILVSVQKMASGSEVRDVLHRKISGNPRARPHGFPVVEPDGQLGGLVTREALARLLKGEGRLTSGDGDQPIVEENVRHMFSTGVSAVASRQVQSVASGEAAGHSPLGVEEVMDTAPFVVQPSTPVHQIHTMFRQLGLRHVVVVDERHRPLGMLTRKSLMPWRCPVDQDSNDSFSATRHARDSDASRAALLA